MFGDQKTGDFLFKLYELGELPMNTLIEDSSDILYIKNVEVDFNLQDGYTDRQFWRNCSDGDEAFDDEIMFPVIVRYIPDHN